MSRFNTATLDPTRTTNLAGGAAYTQDPRSEIASLLLTSFASGKFHETAADQIQRLQKLVQLDPLFAAKAAIYARNEYGMRSISHVAAVEVVLAARGPKPLGGWTPVDGSGQLERQRNSEWVKHFIEAVVRRPDDMLEILSYYKQRNGGKLHPLPNSIKKGFQLAFFKFDSYQLGKYRGEGKDVSLIDVVNLVRPLPGQNAAALKDLVNGELRSDGTWERTLSGGGNWDEMIQSGRLGYMALLKNLRNIAQSASDASFDIALEQLLDVEQLKRSLVLPMRFQTAYEMIGAADGITAQRKGRLLAAVSDAADLSLDNVPVLEGSTLIALDASGSMTSAPYRPGQHRGQGGASMPPSKIGALFAAALVRSNPNAALVLFDTQLSQPAINPRDSLLTVAEQISRSCRGGGTNLNLVFDQCPVPFDRVIILSDMQAWVQGRWNPTMTRGYGRPGYGRAQRTGVSALDTYKVRTGANPIVHSFDLAGHGSLQFPAHRCFQLAGFSDKTFDILRMLEQDRMALVNAIEATPLQ